MSGTSVGRITRRICSMLWRSGLCGKSGGTWSAFIGGRGLNRPTHQTTVHGEDLLIDDSSNWEAVETIGEGFPELDVVTPFA